MSQTAIRFENVGKLYRLGTVGTGTIAHDLQRWWITSVLHKEDPYLKIGETNDRSSKGHSDYVYALKDITFDVKKGDVLGIIGKNGAGKSTLLKLLSRVTYPSIGNIYIKGRIASLLEVGTGFHPELTGRENIYMNGSILGMKKSEIDRKLDEIVDFSGCERYLDTPVKRFSSGMMVRLGFAVAAHLEPEILVVDEVLAVGDAEFQKKAIGKMQDVSKGEGRTVLFVSHNMSSIQALCNNCIILQNGQIYDSGPTAQMVAEYININSHYFADDLSKWTKRSGNGIVKFVDAYIADSYGGKIEHVLTGDDIELIFIIYAQKNTTIDIGFSLHKPDGDIISNLYSGYQNQLFDVSKGENIISCKIRHFPFAYSSLIVRGLIKTNEEISDWPHCNLFKFDISKGDFYYTGRDSSDGSVFLFSGEWSMKK